MMENQDDQDCYVFLDFTFDKVPAGRVVIKLFKNIVPLTAENFRALCTGEKGVGAQGKPLFYKGSKIHRVIPQCMVQGGDIINGDGTGGESIYGAYFANEKNENYNLKHTEEGMVGCCTNGPDKNSSQFYITTVPCTHLDHQNVIFGKVVKGLDVIREMSEIPRVDDVPEEDILISNCGAFEPNQLWGLEENDGTPDIYPPWPNDWDNQSVNVNTVKQVVENINQSGNVFFYRGQFKDAERKYKKVVRYIDWFLQQTRSKSFLDLRNNALLNMTAVSLKLQKNKKALQYCNEILKSSPHNGKAYYRRARARLALKDYDEALRDLKSANRLHPNDRHIKAAFETLKAKKQNYLQKEIVFCSKVFSQ
ncbi:unnamed protein product [Ceutorhynchus assimilis]|uniref:peptidylprolyl isomerase n=1 Tax=Ceutorhynchus assimilis TaxID=467358 RepID=A0A9N9MLE6_9CUCU|nr:unnamed protein product [Ceutorhynchus assimilis]